jgi:curved DNA-binding protein
MGDLFKDLGFGGGDMFSTIFGKQAGRQGGRGGKQRAQSWDFGDYITREQQPERDLDLNYELEIPFMDAIRGGEKRITFSTHTGTEEVNIKIPKGISTGKKLRLQGKGNLDQRTGRTGDLYITIKVGEHPFFKRVGNDLYVTKDIKVTDAILGTTVEVPSIEGPKRVTIPPGVKSHAKVRLKGLGVTDMSKGTNGDQYVEVLIDIPKRLTDRQKTLLEELKREGI